MSMNPFEHDTYLLRKQVFKLFGGSFRIYDPSGSLALFASLKAFRLKEDIRIYADESRTTELLNIKARSIIDFSAAYDVIDTVTGEKVGVLKRRGLKSMFKDEWVIMDASDTDIGIIEEDSWLMAILRRFPTGLIPQSFHGTLGAIEVFRFHQHFNPFVQKLTLDFTYDRSRALDRRLGVAAAILMCAIEGRQRSYP